MKETYIAEYQENYQMNLNQKFENIEAFKETIQSKKDQLVELQKLKSQNVSMMQKFFHLKIRAYYFKICMHAWKKYLIRQRKKNRIAAYTRNTIHRNRMKRFFKGWQEVSHNWGKERITRESAEYRLNMETERLTMWTSKVDQLMLYLRQLEGKIKTEVQAREHLTIAYEQSLNKGVQKVNRETELLADNPLVNEISLVVAKQLLTKSQQDPDALNSMLTQEQRQSLAQLKQTLNDSQSQ